MHELRRLRKEQGLSQTELARRAGVDKDTLNQIELGRREARLGTLEKLADALGVEVGDLFPKAESQQSLELAQVAAGSLVVALLNAKLGHTHLRTSLDKLYEDASSMSVVELQHQLVELGDEVRYLKELFLDLPHFVLGYPKGTHVRVTETQHFMLAAVARAIQDAWRGARPRAQIMAAEVRQRQHQMTPADEEIKELAEKVVREAEQALQEEARVPS